MSFVVVVVVKKTHSVSEALYQTGGGDACRGPVSGLLWLVGSDEFLLSSVKYRMINNNDSSTTVR
jgi:hypothetical protein